jgi:hypothetical protein
MRPKELVALLTSREQTWEVIQATSDPALQRARGWDRGGVFYHIKGWRPPPEKHTEVHEATGHLGR